MITANDAPVSKIADWVSYQFRCGTSCVINTFISQIFANGSNRLTFCFPNEKLSTSFMVN